MGVLIDSTFQAVSYESAENGDFSDQGFNFENVGYSFRELIDLIAEHPIASCSHSSIDYLRHVWFSDHGDTCYTSGDNTINTIHLSHNNKPMNIKYWNKAILHCINTGKIKLNVTNKQLN